MGVNGAGEGQGRNSVTATPTKQSNTEGGVLWSGMHHTIWCWPSPSHQGDHGCCELKSSLIGTLHDFGIKPHTIYFQQDNDPKHMSKLAKDFLTSKHIDILDWLPSSPDMSPIRNVWDHLDHIICLQDPLPTNLDQLWAVLEEEWGKLDQKYIDKLYASLPNWVQALKKAKGCTTHY